LLFGLGGGGGGGGGGSAFGSEGAIAPSAPREKQE